MDRTIAAIPAAELQSPGTAPEHRAPGAMHPAAAAPQPQEAASNQIVVGNIPQQPPGFQPRPDLLRQLNQVGQGVLVLTGMRGVGKTQLAAAYARVKLARGWRLVAWVNAESTGSLLAGLAAVADAAGLSYGDPGQTAADAGQAVRHRLEADGDRCLLVFDDARDPDALRPFVPVGGAGRVLITSSWLPGAGLGTDVPVDVFDADQALDLLGVQATWADDEAAEEVAAELGYLPLALAQAAAVIAGQHLEFGTYLERLRALSLEQQLIPGQGRPYPSGVAQAVLLSLGALQASDQSGVCNGVMEILAVLSATGVRRELLLAAEQAGVLARGNHRVVAPVVDQALAQLAERSLLTFSLDGQVIIVHRFVARVIREGLARQERLTAVCRFAASVLATYARGLDASQDRAAARDIPEHVTALLDSAAGPTAEADQELAMALLRLRFLALYHLIELGDSAPQAIAVGKQLTADLEAVLGPDHPDTLNARNSLAAAFEAAGRSIEAIPLFEVTLAAREQVLGLDQVDTLTSRNNLATAYQDTGRFTEAIRLFEQVLAARERVLGANHRSTVNSRGNLAAAYLDAGRAAEAVGLFEQVLATRDLVLGPDHPDTLRTQNNLAAAYRKLGRSTEATALLQQTLAAVERLLGADHPKTLASRDNLAIAYRDAGRAAEAIRLLEQNLAICERRLGADHPRTLSTKNNLTVACQAAGRPR